jgi:hypothetical protein
LKIGKHTREVDIPKNIQIKEQFYVPPEFSYKPKIVNGKTNSRTSTKYSSSEKVLKSLESELNHTPEDKNPKSNLKKRDNPSPSTPPKALKNIEKDQTLSSNPVSNQNEFQTRPTSDSSKKRKRTTALINKIILLNAQKTSSKPPKAPSPSSSMTMSQVLNAVKPK